jgi:hypothetical protein
MLKKFYSMLFLVLIMAGSAFAIDWHQADRNNVTWDTVTTLTDGGDIPAGDIIRYRLYRVPLPVFLQGGAPELMAEISETEYKITFEQEGPIVVGVSAIRYIDVNGDGKFDYDDLDPDGNPSIQESSIAWSFQADPPFGFSI